MFPMAGVHSLCAKCVVFHLTDARVRSFLTGPALPLTNVIWEGSRMSYNLKILFAEKELLVALKST